MQHFLKKLCHTLVLFQQPENIFLLLFDTFGSCCFLRRISPLLHQIYKLHQSYLRRKRGDPDRLSPPPRLWGGGKNLQRTTPLPPWGKGNPSWFLRQKMFWSKSRFQFQFQVGWKLKRVQPIYASQELVTSGWTGMCLPDLWSPYVASKTEKCLVYCGIYSWSHWSLEMLGISCVAF